MRDLFIKNIISDSYPVSIYVKDGSIEKIFNDLGKNINNDFIINHLSKYYPSLNVEELEILDGEGMTILPSFVNMHTHAAMTMMRGVGEDMPLMKWLDEIWKLEEKLTPELIYWGTKLACLEMIKTGTTLFNDQYWMIDNAVRAINEMGIRAHLTYVFLDQFNFEKATLHREECLEMFEQSKLWGDKITFGLAIHGVYTVSEESILWVSNFARQNGLKVHIHLSESEDENQGSLEKYGMTPTEYLDSLGLLSDNVIAAHSLWLTDKDIEILGKRRVTVVHNINSNLKLASGFCFRYKELEAAGARITIGTDGCASSNNLDMLETMKTTALVQKAWRKDPAAMPLDKLIYFGSKSGFEALDIGGGEIKKGSVADFMLINTNNYSFVPDSNFIANLIYASNSSVIDTLVCGGEVLMRNRLVRGEAEILNRCKDLYKTII